MKYNEKYNLFVDDDLVIYRWSKTLDKLVQCKIYKEPKGYLSVKSKIGVRKAHRFIWETLVGEIPDGFEIDHINTIRDDNRLENLRVVTRSENMLNPITRKHNSEAQKGKILSEEHKRNIIKTRNHKTNSDFGRKFKEHYEITNYENPKLYAREYHWYYRHNKTCRWEK